MAKCQLYATAQRFSYHAYNDSVCGDVFSTYEYTSDNEHIQQHEKAFLPSIFIEAYPSRLLCFKQDMQFKHVLHNSRIVPRMKNERDLSKHNLFLIQIPFLAQTKDVTV